MKNTKWMSLVLALVLCLFALPAQAEETVTMSYTPQVELPDNDELFAMYAEGQFYGAGGVSFFGTQAGDTLSGVSKKLYDSLKPMIEAVAAGTRTSTEFALDTSSYATYTAADISAAAGLFKADMDKAIDALLLDCPYELFWYDKISNTDSRLSYSSSGTTFTFSTVVVTMPVAADYAGSAAYTVDTLPAKVAAAVSKARSIVDQYATVSDEAKLTAYRDEIMALVTYDDAAAEAGDSYFSTTDIDPWQLISVFDGDTATNVVCEGYSKAFQYLCDLSTFTDAQCYTVSGTMTGGTGAGAHMWNIVTMGGKNYLVDVTNSDTGTVGEDGGLFMAKATSGSVNAGYDFVIGDATISFAYDDDLIWGDDVLALAVECKHSFTSGVCVLCGEACEHPSFTNGKCDVCGITGGYCGAATNEGGVESVIWTLDNGAFTVSGTGAMADYDSYDDRPWDSTSTSITSLSIGEGVTRIGKRAFLKFIGLTSVTIPASVESLGYCAFTFCSAMETVAFAAGSQLTTLESFVFQNCWKLKQITLPAGVTSFDAHVVFDSCTAMTDIFVAEGNTVYKDIDGVLYTADGGTLVRYPASKAAESFTTPAGVTTIGERAFSENAELKTVILSEGVTSIGDGAFDGCNALTTVNAPCSWNENPLYTFEDGVTVNVAAHTPDEDSYTDNTDGTHDAPCAACDGVAVDNGDHTFDATGACVCGATQVASITSGSDTTIYTDFAAALADWTDGTTLTLLDDVTYGGAIELSNGATRTFVGGNFTLSSTNEDEAISNHGTLTIVSGGIVSTGNYGVTNDGTLTIESGSISCAGTIGVYNFGALNIKGGKVSGGTTGVYIDSSNSAAIAGGEISGFWGVVIDNGGKLTISGGKIGGSNYDLAVNSGTLTVEAEAVPSTGWTLLNQNQSGEITVGTEIILPADYYVFDAENKIVTTLASGQEGTILKHSEHDTITYTDNGSGTHDGVYSCCGLTAVDDVSHTFDADNSYKCICGAQAVASIGADYYTTLAAAFGQIEDGETATITLLNNVTLAENETLNVSKGNTILDLQGHSITANVEDLSALTLRGGSLTLKGNGSIANSAGTTILVMAGTFSMENGTLGDSTDYTAIESQTGTIVNLKGGALKGGIINRGTMTLDGATVEGSFLLSGGSFTANSGIFSEQEGIMPFEYNGGTAELSEAFCKTNITAEQRLRVIFSASPTGEGNAFTLPEGYAFHDHDGNACATVESDQFYYIGTHTHEYTYTDNEDGTHTGTCACGATSTAEAHTSSYAVSGSTITATCSVCEAAIGTATISAAGKTYDTTACAATVTKTGALENEDIPVTYTAAAGSALTNGQPVNVGTYTASITLGEVTASADFTIAVASISEAEVMLNPDEFTYDGSAKKPEVTVGMAFTSAQTDSGADDDPADNSTAMGVSTSLAEGTDYTLEYSDNINAGTATVTITGINNYTGTKTATFTIKKADAGVTTAPQVIDGLTYTGTAQALVSAGTATGGTLLYSLDGQTWSEDIPAATDVGDYTVYYMVEGDSNHNDMAAQTVTASIGKGIIGLTAAPAANNRTYDGTEQALVTAGTVSAGTLVYSLEENGTYAAAIPMATNAGSYTVWYYVQGGDNYTDSEKAAVTVTIAPIVLEIDANDAAYAKTYDGTTGTAGVVWKQQPFLAEGVLSGDEVRLTDVPFPGYDTKNVGSRDAEISYELVGADALNYKLTNTTVTVTAIIDPKPLTAVAEEYTRAYNASALLEKVPLTLSGVIDGDEVTATADFQMNGIHVGEYAGAMLWTEPELSGEDRNNYTIEPTAVTFTKATITKAAADKWSYTIATPQDVLVGSGIGAVTLPASGTGIGGEAVESTGVAFYTDAAMQTSATDAAISGLKEDESITLYYKADAANYEATTGFVTLTAIDHQHEWTYAADEDANTITAKCSGTIGTCPNATITYKLVIPTGLDFNSAGNLKVASCEITPANASGVAGYDYSYTAISDNAILKDGKPHNAGDYEVTMLVNDAATVSGTLTIAPAQISQPSSYTESGVYTGEAHEPTVNIPSCVEDTDYTITYPADMINAGEKTLTVTGKGNYTGSYELGYEITKAVPVVEDFIFTAPADLVYDGTEKVASVTTEKTGMGEISVSYYRTGGAPEFAATPIEANDYLVAIDVAEGDNYQAASDLTSSAWCFEITSAPADLTAETYLGETMTGSFTYGDVITIKGAVTVDQPRTFSLRRAPAANEVALYLEGGNEVIAGPVAADAATGEFTLTYDTSNKDIEIGQKNLTLKYVSDGNKQDTTGSLTVTLNQKELTIASAEAPEREYEKGNNLVNVTKVNLEGIISGDDVAADLNGVQGTLPSDNAGSYMTLALPQLNLIGSDKDYYTIAADDDVFAGVLISSVPLISVELPTDVTLDTYLSTAEQVAAKLPATVVYTATNGDTVALDAAWSCTGYNAEPKATNTFTWTVDAASLANYAMAAGVATTGTITVTNTDALPVTLTGTDDEITFAEQPYDVAAMFTIDANAGAAHYEVVSGEAVMDGTSLSVTKVGDIIIRLTTDAHDAFAAAEATAKLTVTKADPDVTAPSSLTATYGQNLANVTLPDHDEGTWAWVDEDTNVGDAGVQTHEITFTPNDTTNWNTLTLEAQVTVNKVGTTLAMKVYNGETETSTFTYGETITVMAQPMRPVVLSLRSFTAPAADQMALFTGNTQISEAVEADENGIYTMTIATTDKALKIGDNTITAKYVGTDNVQDAEAVAVVTLQKKQLLITSIDAQSRVFQPENQQVAVTAVALMGKVDGDDVAVAGMNATVSSPNVGTYGEATLPASITLSGQHAEYYEAEGDVTVSVPDTVQITQATPTASTATGGQPSVIPVTEEGKTLADVPLTLPEGAYNVPGTIRWVDAADTPIEEGKAYTWVFTPSDPNYAPVTGTLVVFPAGEAPVITAPTAEQTLTVLEGETGTMTVIATDAEKYQWYINRNDGKGYVPITGAASASYTTSAVNPDNDGFTYYCAVSNAYGESKTPVFTLKVQAEVNVPQTGDEAQLGLWLVLMLLSLGGLTAMVMNRKRGEN